MISIIHPRAAASDDADQHRDQQHRAPPHASSMQHPMVMTSSSIVAHHHGITTRCLRHIRVTTGFRLRREQILLLIISIHSEPTSSLLPI
eukprot:952447-Rhodomonas_salina.2